MKQSASRLKKVSGVEFQTTMTTIKKRNLGLCCHKYFVDLVQNIILGCHWFWLFPRKDRE